MSRLGMTIPLAGIPLADHRDWLREMIDLGYTDFWSSEAGGTDAGSRRIPCSMRAVRGERPAEPLAIRDPTCPRQHPSR